MTCKFETTRRTALSLIAATLALPRAALAGGLETSSGTAFGTLWRISAPHGSGVALLGPEVETLFAEIDALLSPWRPDSEISRFNAGPAGERPAAPALVEVTEASLDIARRSGGAFDPTVGPLVAQWGFGPILHGGSPDWRAISAGPGGIGKTRADLTLDLCGIAKGWALDQAVARLQSMGMNDLLFELGGEFAALGHHPHRRAWRIAVESPLPGRTAPVALRLPAGLAVATSGTREQSYQLQGHRYSHIIDPLSRTPVFGALRSVTVVADDAMTADGWATALFAAGSEAGPDLALAENIAALFLIEDDGALLQIRTGPIEELIL